MATVCGYFLLIIFLKILYNIHFFFSSVKNVWNCAVEFFLMWAKANYVRAKELLESFDIVVILEMLEVTAFFFVFNNPF